MTELRVETYEMPAARLGPENPLPPLRAPRSVHADIRFDESVPPEDRKYFGYGGHSGSLPYRLQQDYDRVRRPREFRVAVLENDRLRATFLTGLGGRLWSLVHKPPHGPTRELLYVNPVFQPGNLAVRNAWFTGGVEWNGCIPGHSVLTCSPLFAARARADDGSPVLRLYEWNRVREVPFQMDFLLPDGSDFLLARVRLTNPHGHEIPMYWWSNIAFPERRDVRVLAPAERAFHHDYATGIRLSPVPMVGGIDRTYPTNMPHSGDFFFRIPSGRRPWIAALYGDGRGLVHASTRRLIGRKLFVWGMGRGGRRWQDFLSEPGNPYIEIQAGITRTQSECLPMPAGAEWTWLEGYGPAEVEGAVAHGSDWQAAWRAVEGYLDRNLPQEFLEEELARSSREADRPPEEVLQRGSGWGALERLRRERAGEKPFCSQALVFDDGSLGEEQRAWLALLGDGELPYRDPEETPGAYMVQGEWRGLLEEAVREGRDTVSHHGDTEATENAGEDSSLSPCSPCLRGEVRHRGRGDHWLSWLHLGVMRYQAGEPEGAREAWEKSVGREPSAWAYRNLAMLARDTVSHHGGTKATENGGEHSSLSPCSPCLRGEIRLAVELIKKAREMAPRLRPLAVECCSLVLDAGRPRETLELLGRLPPDIRGLGRIRVLEAVASFRAGDLDRAEKMLVEEIDLSDVREGETLLTQTWFALHAKRIAEREGIATGSAAADEELEKLYDRAQREHPPPEHIDFRMSTGPMEDAPPHVRQLWRRLLK